MNNTDLFRTLGSISRTAMNNMNKIARTYNLDNNLFLYLFRIVENPGISLTELTNLVKYEKSTISRALLKLEKLQFITKETNPTNKKYIQLFPSTKALEVYKILAKEEKKYIDSTLKNLSTDDKKTLNKILAKISKINL